MISSLCRIEESEDCGRYVVATADIPKGTLVHASLPYAFANPPEEAGHIRRLRCDCCLLPLPTTSSAAAKKSKKSKPFSKLTAKEKAKQLSAMADAAEEEAELKCPKCPASFCSKVCRDNYMPEHLRSAECQAGAPLSAAMLNKSKPLASWLSLAGLILARAMNEGVSLAELTIPPNTLEDDRKIELVRQRQQSANPEPPSTVDDGGSDEEEASTEASSFRIATTSVEPREQRRLRQYEGMPQEVVHHVAARPVSMLDVVIPEGDAHVEWLKNLWVPGKAFTMLPPPTWSDVAGLVCNTYMIDKEMISLFKSTYRTYKRQLVETCPSVFPDVSEEMFIRVCGAIKCNSFEFSDNSSNTTGTSLLPAASYFNHSCAPNLAAPTNGKIMVCYTLRDVNAGEALCISYSDLALTTTQRRLSLARSFLFWCRCALCDGRNPDGSTPIVPTKCPSCGLGWVRTVPLEEAEVRQLTNPLALTECTMCTKHTFASDIAPSL